MLLLMFKVAPRKLRDFTVPWCGDPLLANVDSNLPLDFTKGMYNVSKHIMSGLDISLLMSQCVTHLKCLANHLK